jgi:hypothetical protein
MSINQTIGQPQPWTFKILSFKSENSTNSTSLKDYESLEYTSFDKLQDDAIWFPPRALLDAGLRHKPIADIYKRAIDSYGTCRIDPYPPKACLITPFFGLCCKDKLYWAECVGYQNKKLVYEIYGAWQPDKIKWTEIRYKPDSSSIKRTFNYDEKVLFIDEFFSSNSHLSSESSQTVETITSHIPSIETITSQTLSQSTFEPTTFEQKESSFEKNNNLVEEEANWTIHSKPPLQAALIALGIVVASYVAYKISSKVADLFWGTTKEPSVDPQQYRESLIQNSTGTKGAIDLFRRI